MDFAKLFSFDGRISRRSFWFSTLVVLGFGMIVALLSAILNAIQDGLGLLGALAYIPAIWVSLATSVKRWHDRGKSWAWILIGLIPVVGIWAIIETGFLAGEPGDNTYGSPESGSPFTT
jgi:uncharacterized membrane protein YhaH (DUF805 family)